MDFGGQLEDFAIETSSRKPTLMRSRVTREGVSQEPGFLTLEVHQETPNIDLGQST